MLTIAGYKILEKLSERADQLVFRAFSEKLKQNVILKVLRSEYPSEEQIASYESEFELLKEIQSAGVPKAFEMINTGQLRSLVLEDIQGRPLSSLIAVNELDLNAKVRVAVEMARALSQIHDKGVIHRDIKPENIIFNPSSGQLQIVDFGLARKAGKIATIGTLTGSLHYISPEQTGRTQNPVDYRSDFYSLGVTLYELFAGKLPFTAQDEMEWVHNHIAISETPLSETNPEVPLPISLIIQKLMRKSPDERYQSGLGIVRDLETCVGMKTPADFLPGQFDSASTFRLSSKLYGREEEIKLVNKIIAKVVLGENRLALVDGDPGVGKSSLVNVVKESVNASRGYFVFGKFDQFRRDVPFSALIHAFNQLVSQILTEDETQIRSWKDKLTAALKENASIVTDILPQLELIIGKPQAAPALQGLQQQQRFQDVFLAFIRACSERGRPLVIFLDDLQWADSASRSLMQMFLTEHGAESLLIIGAYRQGEVTASHPLQKFLAAVADKSIAKDEIHLTNLSLENVYSLIKDSFPVPKSNPLDLAKLVVEKTNGNPFFVSQFLRALYEKSLLRFVTFEGWTWDLDRIRAEEVTSNVLSLLTEKIKSLPDDVQETLQLAACFGNLFRIEELKSYNQKTDVENSILLQPAVQSGLVVSTREGQFKFVHDRVQEAAYAMVTPVMRANIHYRIARELLRKWDENRIRDEIFYLVNHFNAGREFLETTDEFVKGAELNLIAAQRAKDSSVYDVALNYASIGLSILNSSDWDLHGALLKSLMVIRATCEYSVGQFDESEKSMRTLLSKLSSKIEKAQLYRMMIEVAHVNDRNEDAITLLLAALKLFGLKVRRNPNKIFLLFMILQTRRLLRKRLRSHLREGDKPNSDVERETLALLKSGYGSAYAVSKNLLAYVGIKSVQITLNGGYMAIAPRSLFNVYLCHVLKDFRTTKESVDNLIQAIAQKEAKDLETEGLFTLQAATMHMVRPFKETIQAMDRTVDLARQQGNLLYVATSSINAYMLSLFTVNKLDKSAGLHEMYLGEWMRSRYGGGTSVSALQLTNTLRGIVDPELTEEKVRALVQKQDSPMPRAWHEAGHMFALTIMGDYASAFASLKTYEDAFSINPFTALATQTRFLSALVRLKNLRRLAGWEKIKQKLKARTQLKFFKKLSKVNPTNFEPPYLMLLGQWNASRGRPLLAVKNLQAAILASQKSEVVFYEPLANELLADVCFDQGLDRLGNACIRDCLYLYQRWGAEGKVRALTAKYPELISGLAQSSESRTISRGTITSSSSQSLDLKTVLKATNAINSEIEMSRLVHKLLNIVIENAGAERAVLFLNENQQLSMRGEISPNSEQEFRLMAVRAEDYKEVPKAMISYVARTLEPMVLDDSTTDERLNRDEYVRQNRVLSTACLPILSQGGLRGLIYLEHRAAKGVFSKERVELMTILSSQIAISLENADLYAKQGEAIRMQNELVTAHAVQEMLFPPSTFELPGARVSGYYQPATECGGDWWSYSKIGDWIYCYIGDATGHGAPAALVTSAACSAVSVIESQPDVTPEKAMELLNAAVCRATKGQIHMTFLIGALNPATGEFKYVRASHESPLLLRKKNLRAEISMRKCLESLMGDNGSSLGVTPDEKYTTDSIQLEPGDTIVFFTDGLPELTDKDDKTLGERGFLDAVHKACLNAESVVDAVAVIGQTVQKYRDQRELLDDVTLCMIQYTGEGANSVPADQDAA